MQTRVATAIADGDSAAATAALANSLRESLGELGPVLIVVMASTSQPISEVAAALGKEFPGAVIASISTAGEFIESGDRKASVSAFALAGDVRAYAGMGVGLRENSAGALETALAGLPTAVEGYPHRTALLLVDALAGNGEETTLTAAAILGPDFRLAGGAAGDDLALKHTFVGLGSRVEEDAAVVVLVHTRTPVGLGVAHGHEEMSRSYEVTRASGPMVQEIDGRPAWDVWREAASDELKRLGVDPENIPADREGGLLLTFEAGLRTGADLKIRAPLARTADGALQFACELPVGSVFRFTKSTPESQVASAKLAARRAREALGDHPVAGALVFDCICRNLILGSRFAEAVHGMREELGGARLAGFETYGEIALDAGDMSGFHNTTSVVLAFAES